MRLSKHGPAWDAAIGLMGITVAFAVVSPFVSWWKLLALYALANLLFTNGILFFLITRHLHLVNHRKNKPVRWSTPCPPSRRHHEDYYLLVLGSGGHTKEMLMMLDDGFCDFANFHRRYLVSSGDQMSVNHLSDFEADLKTLCDEMGSDPGTFDVRVVKRARRVHQSLLTTPFTALMSLYDIFFSILKSPPPNNVAQQLPYPRLIISNGPATGFFVGLAVHILKMLYVIPQDMCCFVYIESWARISTLSLTGKLFYYTGIADAFAVQHEEVARKYGILNVGPMVFNSRRPAPSRTS